MDYIMLANVLLVQIEMTATAFTVQLAYASYLTLESVRWIYLLFSSRVSCVLVLSDRFTFLLYP